MRQLQEVWIALRVIMWSMVPSPFLLPHARFFFFFSSRVGTGLGQLNVPHVCKGTDSRLHLAGSLFESGDGGGREGEDVMSN